ncbi:MAG TPA: phosphatase PAP2 family protein [Gaiellaceae bacterium]|nr:phosphatase PAP2 family protein [Gaiellaceae bacterium]
MDWRLYKDIYDVSLHHHWLGSLFSDVEQASIPFMVVATAALWLLARPGGDRKWKLASGSAFTAAALALVVNLVIHAIWDRPRPYESHSIAHPWSSSTDASFPSDHASASLAIAFTLLVFDLPIGVVFLVAAGLIAVGRVFIGAHYPGDVGASILVALGASALVVRFARPLVSFLVRLVERATDPVLRPFWRRA